jgi:peptide-methionine (R)-S-oxide reductase
MNDKIHKTLDEWRHQLTPGQFHVTREKGTEPAFTGQFWNHRIDGTYVCVCCGATLFDSTAKFDSGTGWPSFHRPTTGALDEHADESYGMRRIEVQCRRCEAHLGHVFDDGPEAGLRYCINSASLKFLPRSAK